MNTSNYTITFVNQTEVTGAGIKWYRNLMNMYKNILEAKGFTIRMEDLGFFDVFKIKNGSYIETAIENISTNNIYLFNPVDFATFLFNLPYFPKINDLFKNIKYIVIWQESLKENLSITGYPENLVNKNFVFNFFNNSLLNIVGTLSSIRSLEKNNILKNKHYIMSGYSLINRITPFLSTDDKDIDIFIYGTLHETFTYRNNIIHGLLNYNQNKYNIVVLDNVYNDNLDHYLKRTKIVLHVNSHQGIVDMPWAKITYLQARKIFFIIEDNDELHIKKLEDTINYYKKNDVVDLYQKLESYLNDPLLREEFINKNYEYIVHNSNMDIIFPDIIESALHKN